MKDNKPFKKIEISIIVILVIVFSIILYVRQKNSSYGQLAPGSTCISVSQAVNDENSGQTECVSFHVRSTYVSSSGNAYLDQYSASSSNGYGFIVWMPSSDSFGSNATQQYANQQVSVTGQITSYEGYPEIEVTKSSQIQFSNQPSNNM